MPPAYVFFLWPFFFIKSVVLRNIFILSAQAVIGATVIVGVYLFTEYFVQKRAGLLAASIAAFLPEFVYATSSYSPTVLFHLGLLLLLWLLEPKAKITRVRRVVLYAVAGSFLLYLRSEMVLFVSVGTILLVRLVDIKGAVAAALLIFALQLPWQVRNWAVFGDWIPLTTSNGLNFFRGHNEAELGAWGDGIIETEIRKIPYDVHFELAVSRLYSQSAWRFIVNHPMDVLSLTVQKFIRFWFINSEDERSRSMFYLVPWVILLGFGLTGLVQLRSMVNHRAILCYLVCATIVAIFFFVLPRYQTMMKMTLVPFAASSLLSFRRRIVKDDLF